MVAAWARSGGEVLRCETLHAIKHQGGGKACSAATCGLGRAIEAGDLRPASAGVDPLSPDGLHAGLNE